MIIGIGCDIVEHKITSKLAWIDDLNVLNRLFTKSEIEGCPKQNQERYYSSRFAVKEAILKCLDTGMDDGISLKEIEIRKTASNSVEVLVGGQVKQIADEKNITNWHISISHLNDSSVVFVIAENRN